MEDDMNYQFMQFLAREKHQQLLQEARRHRLAQQVSYGHAESNQPDQIRRVAAAIAALANALAVAISR
jgi:hypothetical protein